MNAARCLLIDAKLPEKYWAEAVNTANYLHNMIPTRTTGKTPYERWKGREVSREAYQALRTFGAECHYAILGKKKKLSRRAKPGIILGYSSNKKGYRILDKEEGKIIVSRDVVIDESNKEDQEPTAAEDKKKYEFTLESEGEEDKPVIPQENTEREEDEVEVEAKEVNEPESISRRMRRKPRINYNEEKLADVIPSAFLAIGVYAVEQSYIDEPKTYEEAVQGPEREQWEQAIQQELQALEEKEAFEEVSLPSQAHFIDTKWKFKKKLNSKGQVTRYKARLVARGFQLRKYIDYEESYAPVLLMTSFRVLWAAAAALGMAKKIFDFKLAYLNSFRTRQVYAHLPKGYKLKKDLKNAGLILVKALYGLPDSGYEWNCDIHKVLLKLGFWQSMVDKCVYIRRNQIENTIIGLFVDDIVAISTSMDKLEQFKRSLSAEFQI
jgi:hypothetical protein